MDSKTEPPPAVIGYAVPNFGADPDMATTMNSLKISEEINNHDLVMGTPESKAKWHIVAKDTLYNYAPALDKEVISTNQNIADAEDKLGVTFKDANLIQSDPIFSSLGKPAGYKEKKIDTKIIEYRDPAKDGLDSDIIETHKSNDLVAG